MTRETAKKRHFQSAEFQPLSGRPSQERLYSEIGKLKMELDWIKKKSGVSQ